MLKRFYSTMHPATVKSIFQECQENVEVHQKLIRALTKIFERENVDSFFEDFVHCLKTCLIVSERAPVVDRVLEFVAKFVNSLDTSPVATDSDDKGALKNNTGKKKYVDSDDDASDEGASSPGAMFHAKFWEFLLGAHGIHSQHVRLHVCDLITHLLLTMNEDAQIDAELFHVLQRVMLKRLQDKVNVIRVQAVCALARLQDVTDPNCPVYKAFVDNLSRDPHPEVRSAILQRIVVTKASLLPVLGRTRDVKDTVRKAAFEFFANRVHIRSLSIAQRIQILKNGLSDRSVIIQKIVRKTLLPKWLSLANSNILQLLHCLDVEDASDISQEAVKELLSQEKAENVIDSCDFLSDLNIIKPEAINTETVFYWKTVCEFFSKGGNRAGAQLRRVMPDAPPFCEFILSYMNKAEEDAIKQMEKYFVCEQFISIAQLYELADEMERQCVQTLIEKLLMSDDIQHLLAAPLLLLLKNVIPSDEGQISYLIELIHRIREVVSVVEVGLPSADKRRCAVELAKMKVEMNILRDEMESCVERQDFGKAQEVKERIQMLEVQSAEMITSNEPKTQEVVEEKNDALTLEKCLSIVVYLCEKDSKAAWPTILSLIESLVIPAIQNEDESVRNLAVRALGLGCLSNTNVASKHLVLFLQVCRLDKEQVRVTALQAVFDILLLYGFEIFKDKHDVQSQSVDMDDSEIFETEPATDLEKVTRIILTVLLQLFDCEYSEVHAVLVGGFCKLLLARRIISAKILSRLIILWYNPVMRDNVKLCNCLGVFLPTYAASSRLNQEVILEAFLPTLNVLFEAPTSSPLCQVNIDNVAKFMIELTKPFQQAKRSDPQDTNIHDLVAAKVCNALLKTNSAYKLSHLAKVLRFLNLSKSNTIVFKDLNVLCQEILRRVDDKTCLASVKRFRAEVLTRLGQIDGDEDDGDGDATEHLKYVPETPPSILRSKFVKLPDLTKVFIDSSSEDEHESG